MDYPDVTGFVADAIGPPGERTFLLQFHGSWGRHTYLLEKGQVAALVAGTAQLEKEVDYTLGDVSRPPLLMDEVPKFRVGQLGLGWDDASQEVVMTVESVNDGDESATYRMPLEHLIAGARQGHEAVSAGRPRCERCGLAMDPEGHACPTTNGDLRNHRP